MPPGAAAHSGQCAQCPPSQAQHQPCAAPCPHSHPAKRRGRYRLCCGSKTSMCSSTPATVKPMHLVPVSLANPLPPTTTHLGLDGVQPPQVDGHSLGPCAPKRKEPPTHSPTPGSCPGPILWHTCSPLLPIPPLEPPPPITQTKAHLGLDGIQAPQVDGHSLRPCAPIGGPVCIQHCLCCCCPTRLSSRARHAVGV